MLNNLLKIGAMIVAGRWLKERWKGLLVLIAFWFLVTLLHSEYIQYVELSEDTSFLWQSSLIKVGLYIAGFLLYIFFVERKLFLASVPPKPKSRPSNTSKDPVIKRTLEEGDDGFDFLRDKPKLESESDKLLNKYQE
jgi:hypothetical protein